jgi:hypothetical protein
VAAILEPLDESLPEENGVASAEGNEVKLLMLEMMVRIDASSLSICTIR